MLNKNIGLGTCTTILKIIHKYVCGSKINVSIAAIYQHFLSDRKFGLAHNLLATKVMPTLIPYTVSPGLSIEQVTKGELCNRLCKVLICMHHVLLEIN